MRDLRIQAALTAERDYLKEREEDRRQASWLAYGHSGAHVPGTGPNDDDRARRMIDAADQVGSAAEHQDSELLRRAGRMLSAIKQICDEPLDERPGHGPTRELQFTRIDEFVAGFPRLATQEEIASALRTEDEPLKNPPSAELRISPETRR